MYDSNSNTNGDFPFEYSHDGDDDHQQNPNYKFLDISSHLLDHDELFLGTILPHQPPPPSPPPPPPPSPPPPLEKGKRKRAAGGPTTTAKLGLSGPKRRKGKDRHSKIYTAHGPRDRRMRLSLQIARKFFDLQDLLGFDKASKTIEWLFNKSKAAIKDLAEKSCTSFTPSSPSEDIINRNKEKMSERSINKQMGGLKAKENREKARARARERTKEKLIMMQKEVHNKSITTTVMKNKQPLEVEQNPSNMENTRADDQIQKLGLDNHHDQSLEDQMASVGIVEKFLATTASSSISNFNGSMASNDPMMRSNNDIDVMDFSGNWVIRNASISDGYRTGFNNIDSTFMGRPYNEGN